MSASRYDILQYGLRNKPKSIKIIATASSEGIFRWIFAYSYFAFDVFLKIKNVEKKYKNVKKRDLKKKQRKRRLLHVWFCALYH